jgi:putative oxidoreductase
VIRTLTGVAFVIAGLPKFVAYGWEHDAFVRFGLHPTWAWVIAAGIIEIGGGILLLRGTLVRPTALLLAVTMAVAIAASGIKEGDVIPSLTVAPALLAACLYLLASDEDRHARRVLPR